MSSKFHLDANYDELVYEINRKRFYPVFQPIYSLDSYEVVGYEVLVRWKNGYSVEESIKQLEWNKGISFFSISFIEEICRVIDKSNLKDGSFISVNLSPNHFSTPYFLSDIAPIIDKCNQIGANLWLELTEHSHYPNGYDKRRMKININYCKLLGIKVVIDDFGTGSNSDESCIERVRPNIVKLDKTFLHRKINSDWEYVDYLSNKYNFDLLVEGVETFLDLDFIKNKKVSFAQGYFFGAPEAML